MGKILGYYENGNYVVSVFNNGEKIRNSKDNHFLPTTIESLTIKITNKCGGIDIIGNESKSYSNVSCKYCSEGSSPFGKHGDIISKSFLDLLHPYCEVNIDGGNPLQHPQLYEFLSLCKERKHIVNITLNQRHFIYDYEMVKDLCNKRLVWGLNVSLVEVDGDLIEKIKHIPNATIQVINGIVTNEQLTQLKDNNLRLKVLGYKEIRRGQKLYEKASTFIEQRKTLLKEMLPIIMSDKWFYTLSLDELAKEQIYGNNDEVTQDIVFNNASLYVDMVERKFAKNDLSPMEERFDVLDNVEEMFTFLHKREN